MFAFLDDINAAVLIYDEELNDYVFIGKSLCKKIAIADLLEFKSKHCHEKSIFSTLRTAYRNHAYNETRRHYFFVSDATKATLCFEINLATPVYEERRFLVFTFHEHTQVQNLKAQLENYKITQAMICTMINSAYNDQDIAALPPHLIASLGIALNVSAVLIYEIAPNNAPYKETYLWHNENINLPGDFLENITDNDRRILYEAFLKERRLIIESPAHSPSGSNERMELATIKSLSAYPIYIDGKPEAAIVLCDCISYRSWNQEAEMMEIVTTILSSVLSRKRKLEKAEQRESQLKIILDNLPFYVHISNYDTHEIIFANRLYRDTLHKDIVGMKCWELTDPDRTEPCPFCKMDQTLAAKEATNDHLTIRYFSKVMQREFRVHESAIRWFDGRYVHFACAVPLDEPMDVPSTL